MSWLPRPRPSRCTPRRSQRLPIEGEPELPRRLDVASLHFHVLRAIGARDGDEPERFAAQLALARARAAAIGDEASTDRRQRQSRMLYAMLVDMDETDPAGAAAAWAAVNSGAEEPDDLDVLVRYHEGRVRLSLGEYETAARLFAPLVAPARSDYLGAIRDAEVEDRGEYFSKLSAHHAYALGALGRWDESLRALDGARSLRLRQRAGLRASRRGRTLLGLERQLYAGERGVPPEPTAPRAGRADGGDRMHGQVSRQARMFERYRRLRPELDAAALESPGVAAIAAVLDEGEAVLSLGNNFTGTVAVLVCHGDGDRPSRAEAFGEWTNEHWMRLIGGNEAAPGWLFALGAPELGLDHAEVLDRLLEGVDAGLGRWIADAVRARGVRRLTIVAHRFLHLLPFWALPSLADVEVASAPSLAHFVASRAPRRSSPRRAVIVENPTGDLPLAAAETAAVEAALAGCRFRGGDVRARAGDRVAGRAGAARRRRPPFRRPRPVGPGARARLGTPDARRRRPARPARRPTRWARSPRAWPNGRTAAPASASPMPARSAGCASFAATTAA